MHMAKFETYTHEGEKVSECLIDLEEVTSLVYEPHFSKLHVWIRYQNDNFTFNDIPEEVYHKFLAKLGPAVTAMSSRVLAEDKRPW